jgi:hypothetical protein
MDKLKFSVTIAEEQIKQALGEWLASRGYDASGCSVMMIRTTGDRPGEREYYSAAVSGITMRATRPTTPGTGDGE